MRSSISLRRKHPFLLFLYILCFWACKTPDATFAVIVSDEKLYDFVLLLDESGSMIHNDPFNVRRPTCKRIIDKLKVSGLPNYISIIKFATCLDDRHGRLTNDYKSLYHALDAGLSDGRSSFGYMDLSTCPPRGFTDTFAALEKAFAILSKSPVKRNGMPVEKVVFLLTDGVVEPWPGRVISVRDRYLKSLLQREASGYCNVGDDNENPQCKFARDESRRMIIEELLPKYRKEGFRIYAVGFGNADENFLRTLSRSTLADYKKILHYSDLDTLIDDYMPPLSNVIELFSKRLCDSGPLNFKLSDKTDAFALTVNFTKSIAELPVRENREIGLIIQGPDGVQYDSTNGVSYRTPLAHNNKAHYSHAYFHLPNPLPGKWSVRLTPSGFQNLCGVLKGEARLKCLPKLTVRALEGNENDFESGLPVEISAYMQGNCIDKRPANSIGGRVESETTMDELHFTRGKTGYRATYLPVEKGDYRVLVVFHLEEGRVKRECLFSVKPSQACALRIEAGSDSAPNISDITLKGGGLNFGIMGFPLVNASRSISLRMSDCHKSIPITYAPPIFSQVENPAFKLPHGWIKVTPANGLNLKASHSQTAEISIAVNIPPNVPGLPDGKYTGELEISSPGLDRNYRVGVSLELKLPRLLLNGRPLDEQPVESPFQVHEALVFDFSSTLTRIYARTFQLKAAGGAKGRDVYFEIQSERRPEAWDIIAPSFGFVAEISDGAYIVERKQALQNPRQYLESILGQKGIEIASVRPLSIDIHVFTPQYALRHTDRTMVEGINITVDPVGMTHLNDDFPFILNVSLANQNIDESRIPAGRYGAYLVVSGDYLRTGYLPLEISIPQRSMREIWSRWLFGNAK